MLSFEISSAKIERICWQKTNFFKTLTSHKYIFGENFQNFQIKKIIPQAEKLK